MKIIKTNFEGLFLIKKEKYLDNRGEFLEILEMIPVLILKTMI